MTAAVLIVISSTDRRGAEIEGMTLAHQLTERGTPAQVVALCQGLSPRGLPIEALGSRALSAQTLKHLRKKALESSVVIAYGSTTLPACAFALLGTRRRFVYRSIGDPGEWSRGRVHRLRTSVLFHRACHVVALWPGAARSIESLYRLDESGVAVIPNARDPEFFRPPSDQERAQARRDLGIGERPTIAIIGSLSAEKRVSLLLQTMPLLPHVDLIVVGDGPLRGDLEQSARSTLGDRCRFLGSVDDVRSVLWAVDLVAMTSRTEGLPGVLIEASMCGVASVTTDVGGIRESFRESESVSLVAADVSPADLAEAIDQVLASRRRSNITERSFTENAFNERFTWQHVVAEWESIIRMTAR